MGFSYYRVNSLLPLGFTIERHIPNDLDGRFCRSNEIHNLFFHRCDDRSRVILPGYCTDKLPLERGQLAYRS